MIPEELLKIRYKVIADYPENKYFKIGDILIESDHIPKGRFGKKITRHWASVNAHDYPHLFKPLFWWEDRKPEDMPEYVRVKDTCQIFQHTLINRRFEKNEICKIAEISQTASFQFFLPATKEEFEEYESQK